MHTFSGLKIVLIEVYCTQKNLLISGQEDVSVGNLVPNAKFFLPYILTMEDYQVTELMVPFLYKDMADVTGDIYIY